MKLNKSKIKILKALINTPSRSSEVADNIGLSMSQTSSLLGSLVEEGLLKKQGWDYSFGDATKAGLLRQMLRRHSGTRFEDILCDTELRVLEALHKGRKSVEELASETGKTPRTIYYKLSFFRSMGLVHEAYPGSYRLNSTHDLHDDLVSLFTAKDLGDRYSHSEELEYADSMIAWGRPPEFIVKTGNPEEYIAHLEGLGYEWRYTSSSAADHYGIHVIPPKTALYVTKEETETIKGSDGSYVAVDDLIIHLLLEKHQDAARYAHWLIQKHEDEIDFFSLKKKALKYKLFKSIDSIIYDLKPILKKKNW